MKDTATNEMLKRALSESLDAELAEQGSETGETPSEEYEKKMKTLFAHTRRREYAAAALKWPTRIAAALFVTVCVATATLMTIPAVRGAVKNAVSGLSLQTTMATETPAYVPEGYKKVFELLSGNVKYIEYGNEAGDRIFFVNIAGELATEYDAGTEAFFGDKLYYIQKAESGMTFVSRVTDTRTIRVSGFAEVATLVAVIDSAGSGTEKN